jgi:hypothetical protein
MRKLLLFLCALCMPLSPAAFGQSENAAPQLPKILIAGFDSYRSAGPDEALRVWLRNSPLDGTPDIGTQERILHAAQGQFGQWRAYEVVSVRPVSPSTQIFYLTLDFDRGPLFAKFVLYHSGAGWIVTNLLFSPNDADVLPAQPL